jgi:hypothetical protein
MPATVLGIADEGRDALMRAALARPDAALREWHRWESSGQQSWATDPIASRWLPLIARNLEDAPLSDRTRQALREKQREAWAANIRRLTAAFPVLDGFAAEGIPVMLLKGAPLAFCVFETPGLRPLGDIDLLVKPADATAASDILRELGWKPSRPERPHDLMCLHGLDHRNRDGAIDLHWYLLHECCWPDADLAVWRRARSATMAGHHVLVPSPADQLLHVAVHGLRWSPVHSAHWVADAIQIIRWAGEDLAWDTVVEEAGRRALRYQMHEALAWLRQGWDASIPDHVLHALATPHPGWGERLECRVKSRPRAGFGGLFVIWRNWRRLERSPDRPPFVRYLATTIGAPCTRALLSWGVRQLAVRIFTPARRPRGTSTRETLGGHRG